MPVDSQERHAIVDAADLLGQLLLQDVERGETGDDADADGGVSLKDWVSKNQWCRWMIPRCATDTRPRWWWTATPS